jgi:hypothetical protein
LGDDTYLLVEDGNALTCCRQIVTRDG